MLEYEILERVLSTQGSAFIQGFLFRGGYHVTCLKVLMSLQLLFGQNPLMRCGSWRGVINAMWSQESGSINAAWLSE